VKTRSIVAIAVLTAIAAACGGGEDAQQAAADSAAARWEAADAGEPMRGIVRITRSGWRFHRCSQPGVMMNLVDSTGTAGFADMASGLEPQVGESLYIEIRVPEGATGPDLPVKQVRRLARVTAGGGSCFMPTGEYYWRASGNEPFWSVEVDADQVVLTTPELPGGLAFRRARLRWAGDRRVYQGSRRGEGERLIEVRIGRVPCRDSMSGAYSAWTAEVRRAESTQTGCAWPGRAEPRDTTSS
jgi:putative lipoprotein